MRPAPIAGRKNASALPHGLAAWWCRTAEAAALLAARGCVALGLRASPRR